MKSIIICGCIVLIFIVIIGYIHVSAVSSITLQLESEGYRVISITGHPLEYKCKVIDDSNRYIYILVRPDSILYPLTSNDKLYIGE